MFRDPMRPGDELFSRRCDRLLERHARRQPAAELRIVVADPQTRMLERLSTALDTAGFSVATATNGMEAIGACLSRTPDVVLIERDMPVVDGLHVLQEMGRHAELASVPVMMMSADATDLVRLQAFQLGAVDFIPKPFTVLEVILRARRWARASQRDTERVVLRGTLAELGLPSLLTMFEQERKSGQLSVTRDQLVAWIDFVEGKIVRARSSELDADSHAVMMAVLDWKDGYFELSAGVAAAGASRSSRRRSRTCCSSTRGCATRRTGRRSAGATGAGWAERAPAARSPARASASAGATRGDGAIRYGSDSATTRPVRVAGTSTSCHGSMPLAPRAAYDRSRITSGWARSTSSSEIFG